MNDEHEVNVDPEISGKDGTEAPLIYVYLQKLEKEKNKKPKVNYLENIQKVITPLMRENLVSWLSEVAEKYMRKEDTFYLCVSYIDIYLSSNALISREKLQLLGVSCMLVASNNEKVRLTDVDKFCNIMDSKYTKQEVIEMEIHVLKVLNSEASYPTIKSFLRIIIIAAKDDNRLLTLQFKSLTSYLAELTLLDYDCLRFFPSMVAASVIFLARLTILPDFCPWTLVLEKCTRYEPSELKECVLTIHELQTGRRCTSVHAIRERYKELKFMCVAELRPPSVIPSLYFDISHDNLLKMFTEMKINRYGFKVKRPLQIIGL